MSYLKQPLLRVNLFGYQFAPNIINTLITLMLLILLLYLGSWQLKRAAEKKVLERLFTQATIPLDINAVKLNKDFQYQRLQVTGQFDKDHLFFLDNKTYQHKIGYHVIAPFKIQNSSEILLVDRGFIAAKTRLPLPSIITSDSQTTLIGRLYFPSKSFLLNQDVLGEQWPIVIQSMAINTIQQKIGHHVYPFYLLLESGDSAPLIREWHSTTLPAYRHQGYAMQWFSLALTLFIIYLFLNTKKQV